MDATYRSDILVASFILLCAVCLLLLILFAYCIYKGKVPMFKKTRRLLPLPELPRLPSPSPSLLPPSPGLGRRLFGDNYDARQSGTVTDYDSQGYAVVKEPLLTPLSTLPRPVGVLHINGKLTYTVEPPENDYVEPLSDYCSEMSGDGLSDASSFLKIDEYFGSILPSYNNMDVQRNDSHRSNVSRVL